MIASSNIPVPARLMQHIVLGLSLLLAMTPLPAIDVAGAEQEITGYRQSLGELVNEPDDQEELSRLISTMRRYRVRLIGQGRSLEASDDDTEAAVYGRLIGRMNALILDAETRLADRLEPAEPSMQGLPEGLDEGIVLHHLFTKPSEIRAWDLSPWGHHAKVQGAHWTQRGRLGGAYWFDGVGDYIQIDLQNGLDVQQALTLSLSLYRQLPNEADRTQPEVLLSRGDAGLWLFLTPRGGVGGRFRDAAGQPLRLSAEPARYRVSDRRWTHLVLSYDGQTVRTYIDGREDKRVFMPGARLDSPDPIRIGGLASSRGQNGFYGKLDGLTIWNRALSETEVLGLWTNWVRVEE